MKKHWFWASRVACLLVTFAFAWRVFHQFKLSALTRTLGSLHPGWLAAALLVSGLVFLLAACRWQIVLRISRSEVRPAVTLRYTLIGHFFYTLLFGSIGGDSAKAALYSRDSGIPFPRVLATAPLDRFLGFLGLLLFASITFGIAGLTGAFSLTHHLGFDWKLGRMILATILLLALASILMRRSSVASGCAAFWASVRHTARTLVSSPRSLLLGVGFGLLVQLALAGVLALSLRAVSHGPVRWEQMLWTFPVIVVVSSLPISTAGLGTREAAAVTLFGIYGVSAPEAAGAALLTLAVNLFWAAVGGLLLTRWKFPGRSQYWKLLPAFSTGRRDRMSPLPDAANLLRQTVQEK